jgi:eukaryotic-like serine/threonine-protein kinase
MTQWTARTPDNPRPSWPRRRHGEGGCDLSSAGALVDDRYQIVGPIGRGGMGRVVEISRLSDCVRLALKYCDGTTLGRRRLVREAKILGSLMHPHVLSVVDANLVHDPPYYVMPLAADTLQAELSSHGGDLAWSIHVFRQVCLGVQGLHQAGVIHRDLKPANVLRLADSRHVVADLGTAKREPRDSTVLTRTCAILGTLCYLAPEQLMPGGSRQADARTDVFQLGKMLYQMITGRSPAVVEPTALPPGLAHIVVRATSTRPRDRYAEVAALLEAVETYQNSWAENAADRPHHVLEELARRVNNLLAKGSPRKEHEHAFLEAIAGLERLPDDEILDGLDRVPTELLAMLARDNPTRFQAPLAGYARSLERSVARRHYNYADFVARRMQAVFQASRNPDIKAQALEALLIAAVVLNRYAAMAVFKLLLYQIKEAEIALRVAEMLRDHRDYFQEVAPGLRSERLHPILDSVINDLVWIETVSF